VIVNPTTIVYMLTVSDLLIAKYVGRCANSTDLSIVIAECFVPSMALSGYYSIDISIGNY